MRNKQLIVLMLSLLLVLNTGCGSESDVQNGVNLRQNQLMGNEIVIFESSDASTEGSSATGNLGGSVGENNFGMTNLMDSIKDNNQTDVEHSLDLEEEKQETQPSSGNEGSVGSDVGSGNGTGNGTQPQTPSNPQPQAPSQSQTNTQPQTDVPSQPQTPSDGPYSSKESVESLDSVKEVTGYNEDLGAYEIVRGSGAEQLIFPNGTTMDIELAKALGLI